jgi:hypothetical protein
VAQFLSLVPICKLKKWHGSTTGIWRNSVTYVWGELPSYDWSITPHTLETQIGHIHKCELSSQSQRHVSPRTSTHGISPDDRCWAEIGSGWDAFVLPTSTLHRSRVRPSHPSSTIGCWALVTKLVEKYKPFP